MLRPQPSGDFVWVQAVGGAGLVCQPLQAIAPHVFTTREWALGSSGPVDEVAWADVAKAVDVDDSHLLRMRQVHGHAVVVQRAGTPLATPRPEADIAVTDDPSIAVAIQTADCVPMLIADRRTGAVAAAHAGWRGLAAGVPAAAIDALAHAFDSRPADLVVAIGPSISGERYEVGPEVRERFALGGFADEQLDRWFWRGSGDRFQFDGWSSAADQVAAAGVASSHIHVAALCTAEYPALFCSYRRDGAGAGRIAAAIRSAVVSSGRSRSGT